jgi:putative transposase
MESYGKTEGDSFVTNVSEISSRHFLTWAIEGEDRHRAHPARKPTEHAHVESFQGRRRDECLNVIWF